MFEDVEKPVSKDAIPNMLRARQIKPSKKFRFATYKTSTPGIKKVIMYKPNKK